MSITAALHHVTKYNYNKPVALGTQIIRLRPAPHVRSNIQSYSLSIFPEKHFINWQQDPLGNFLASVVFPEKVSEFRVEVDLLTEMRIFNPFDFFLEKEAEHFPFTYPVGLKEELAPYLEIKEGGPELLAWVDSINKKEQRIIDFLVEVNQKLNQLLRYTVRLAPGVQSCEETLLLGSGSCRDMASLLCQALRHLGLASRFVSGYLIQLTSDVKSLDGPSGTDVDFTDLHAWTEVYLPGAGWVGLDPTSGLFAGEGHIPLCCTPNPSSAAPITGTLEDGVTSVMEHEMTIARIIEAPRVSKPYSDAQWQAIDTLGEQVDQQLQQEDIRLTMGGEPTFVSLDEREDDAWHYAALGEEKKKLAATLFNRLRGRFSSGDLPMYTQGKWYPGEILPRWAMTSFWRKDGEPIWHESSLLADPEQSQGHDLETASQFMNQLALSLGIPEHYIQAAREDTPYYLWQERGLPLESEIMTTNVYEKRERERLQSLMEDDLNQPVGYVLPLHYSHQRQAWISNAWQQTSPYLVLLTGDSPIGLRLPLSRLPIPDEAKQEDFPERSLFQQSKKLTLTKPRQGARAKLNKPDDQLFKDDPNGLIHTAICTQVRQGVLHVFLPPFVWVEHFLELIAVIESVAASLKTPIVLEGYLPPASPHLTHFSVTPDPGVIEVNVQPAADWSALKNIGQTVYEEARLSRLSAEKFCLDGRRVGTGGGNHLVLGAANPGDSPFLRRPDLLQSLITFWQNHPSLSYLFSGMYIGPMSQAPRIDEARHDSLYELEIAFAQIPAKAEVPPWLVDRLLRHLLVDLTGNTHRAEFCIDKLYSPDSDRGRLGLLEMRGFEMTPHPQMNLLQALLLRAFIAVFWKTPYQGKLIRWGTQLHDRFMLPYFIQDDFDHVLQYLQLHGFDFDSEWFEPFFAFRFPDCGKVQIGAVSLSLRFALEPWPVMGEESNGGSVSRAVDATVERLQVTATGLIEGRQVLTCNGRRVPLTATSENGVQVAGIRFKAWSQPSSLHPKLPVNAPLVFDVIDTVLERSLGGCTYHVAHPGGRNHDSFPVNENEAEGRRLARFLTTEHTPGKVSVPRRESNPEYPLTLDLRR